MVQTSSGLVLKRMIERRSGPAVGPPSMESALRLGLAKAGHEALRLRMEGGDVEQAACTTAELPGLFTPETLLVFIRGRGGACGIAALDAALVASVLEVRTAGRVSDTPTGNRVPTQTDAILARGFIDAVLTELGTRLADVPACGWLCGFHPGERVPEARRLPYLLRDVPYARIAVGVDIAAGRRAARLTLVVPTGDGDAHAPRADRPMALPIDQVGAAPERPEGEAREWRAAFAERVRTSPACLDAVLYRFRLTLAEVATLAPGTVLTLPRSAVHRIELIAPNGSLAERVRLGQSDGRRAVRRAPSAKGETTASDLNLPPDATGQAGPAA